MLIGYAMHAACRAAEQSGRQSGRQMLTFDSFRKMHHFGFDASFDGKVHQKRQLRSQKNALLSMVVYGWLKRLMRSATDKTRKKERKMKAM